jgi:hypothetical protein
VNAGVMNDPENIVRVNPITRPLIKHLTGAKGESVGSILNKIVEEEKNVAKDQLVNSWLTLFEDSLKADAIFLEALSS